MIHIMNLNPEPFQMIADGTKTIELRLYDEKRQQIHIGDTIRFVNIESEGTILECSVIKLHCFSSFQELYEELPLLACGYTKETIETAEASDMNQYYSLDKQKRYGAVGIEVKRIKEYGTK